MCIEILLDALREFYRKDAEKLFDDKKAIDERAMVGCVYRYMWCKLQQLGELDVDIDIEYNRSSNDYSGMDQEKGIVLCGAGEHSKPCLNEESCMKILKSEMLKKERSDALFFGSSCMTVGIRSRHNLI